MKNLNYLNYFFVGMPLFLYLLSAINIAFLCFAMLSTILTGVFQVTIGIKMLMDKPQDKNLQIYIISVALFFFSVIMIYKLELYDYLNYAVFGIPLFLAIYLSLIIYKKANK